MVKLNDNQTQELKMFEYLVGIYQYIVIEKFTENERRLVKQMMTDDLTHYQVGTNPTIYLITQLANYKNHHICEYYLVDESSFEQKLYQLLPMEAYALMTL